MVCDVPSGLRAGREAKTVNPRIFVFVTDAFMRSRATSVLLVRCSGVFVWNHKTQIQHRIVWAGRHDCRCRIISSHLWFFHLSQLFAAFKNISFQHHRDPQDPQDSTFDGCYCLARKAIGKLVKCGALLSSCNCWGVCGWVWWGRGVWAKKSLHKTSECKVSALRWIERVYLLV